MSKQASLFPDEPLNRPPVMASFAEIVAREPNKYRGVMLDVALRTLHREGKPHDPRECPTCRQESAE